MQKTITRRDLLKFTGGGILGLMFSPLPWKLLDDTAIWTQNWSLTPQLSHGPITTLFSHCTLCSGGCAVQADCVSGVPYYLRGVNNHPLTHGTLCTRGLAGHHMAHHPLRIVHPHTFAGKSDNCTMTAVSLQDALDQIAKRINNAHGTVAILDQQPNRAVSEVYREFLGKINNGLYLSNPSGEDKTISTLKEMMNQSSESFGYDFENCSMVLSFGAPLFDNWGIPGRMTSLHNSKKTTIVQIDSRYSRTAMQSNKWIAIQPGTEETLALTIAHVLLFNNRIPSGVNRSIIDFNEFKNSVKDYSPEKTNSITGIDPIIVEALAHQLIAVDSAIVLSGADPGGGPFDCNTEKAIASLNILIGSIGKRGGIVSRKETPGYKNQNKEIDWTNIKDHSIEVLIVDGMDSGYVIPWKLIERKLNPNNNFIVSLSPILNEISAHSDYLIPSPSYLEMMNDVVTTPGNSISTFALSTPLMKRLENTSESVTIIKEISTRLNILSDIPTHEDVLKQKVSSIHSQKRGSIFVYSDQSSIRVSDLSSSDELWTKLTEGAVWIDDAVKQSKHYSFKIELSSQPLPVKNNESSGIPMIAYGWRGATSASQISPILSKVFQETELRNNNGTVSIHPNTAAHLGFSKNETASLSTNNGSMNVRVRIDQTVRPGIIEASVGPLPNGMETPKHPAGTNILNLCEVTNDGTWRITSATLQKV